MRLIDADALIEAYDRAHEGEPGKARQLILDAPTIEERKTGKWIDIKLFGIGCIKCSECNYTEMDIPEARSKYCPNCGAKMGGVNSGANQTYINSTG